MKRLLIIFAAVFLTACGNNVLQNTQQQAMPTSDSYDNTKICWGFRKIKNAVPEVPKNVVQLLERYDSFYVGDTAKKELYLTFDEGYENGYTPKILEVLKKTKTPAAFFVTGHFVKTCPELVKQMAEEGHIVGNHSANHPSLPDVDNATLRQEIEDLNLMVKELTGQDTVYLRAPRGEFSERTLALTKEMGYKNIFWSSAYADWEVNKSIGAVNAKEKIISQLHNGNIILLHAVSKDNADGLELMINEAKALGYTFKSLNDL